MLVPPWGVSRPMVAAPTQILEGIGYTTGIPSALVVCSGVCARPHPVRTYIVAPTIVALTTYNQPGNRAPPCLVSGYHDTPYRVTAEKGPPLLGFLFLANMLSWLSVL